MRDTRRLPVGWIAACIATLAVLPGISLILHSGYWLRLFELSLIFCILAASLNLITGAAGLVSLGHAAFYAVGAYTAGLVPSMHGDLVVTLPASLLTGGALAAIVAVPMLRLLRVFFTVATLSVGEIVSVVLTNWDGLTGGPNGLRDIPPFRLGGIAISGMLQNYYVVAIVTLICLWCVNRLTRSLYGNTLRAMREDEASASAMGLDTRTLKIGIFAISGGLAGVAGCLTAQTTLYISPDMFGLDQSILILTMVVVGGLGSLPGAVVGAFLLTIAPELFRTAGHFRMIMVGVLLFGAILLFPKGLISEERFLGLLRPVQRAPGADPPLERPAGRQGRDGDDSRGPATRRPCG